MPQAVRDQLPAGRSPSWAERRQLQLTELLSSFHRFGPGQRGGGIRSQFPKPSADCRRPTIPLGWSVAALENGFNSEAPPSFLLTEKWL